MHTDDVMPDGPDGPAPGGGPAEPHVRRMRVQEEFEFAPVGWVRRDVTELRRAEAARADLLRQLVTAQEDERRRVSREMHDTFGQLLPALALAVRAARDAAPLPAETDARLGEVQRVTDE